MTLIVANKLDDESIHIVSDTALTVPKFEESYIENRFFRGALKVILINPEICVCYAGTADYAIQIIRQLKSQIDQMTLDHVLNFLLNAHLNALNMETDFIVVSLLENNPAIHKIQKGEIKQNLKTCWIGSYDAFTKYQRLFHQSGQQQNSLGIQSMMNQAMSELIDSRSEDTVGGFLVSLISTKQGFEYSEYAETILRERQTVKSGEYVAIKLTGSSASGSYTFIQYRPLKPGVGAVAGYILQIRTGFLFFPLSLPKNLVVKGVTQRQFMEYIKTTYDLELSGPIFGKPE